MHVQQTACELLEKITLREWHDPISSLVLKRNCSHHFVIEVVFISIPVLRRLFLFLTH